MQLKPAWTTRWMSEDGRRKLREYGIAPAVGPRDRLPARAGAGRVPALRLGGRPASSRRFGATPCQAQYVCSDCLEPFDHFKAH